MQEWWDASLAADFPLSFSPEGGGTLPALNWETMRCCHCNNAAVSTFHAWQGPSRRLAFGGQVGFVRFAARTRRVAKQTTPRTTPNCDNVLAAPLSRCSATRPRKAGCGRRRWTGTSGSSRGT